MTKSSVQYVLPGSGSWLETPICTKTTTSVSRAKLHGRSRPNRLVLIYLFRKSQKVLARGHSIRTQSVITWGHEGDFERWVRGEELSVPGEVNVKLQLRIWESLGYLEKAVIGDYLCWRLIKPIPGKEEDVCEIDI